MNKKLLFAEMAKLGDTQATLADAIGVSRSRLTQKIGGYRGAQFNANEIESIAKRYKLKPKAVYDVFFAEKVE